MQLGVRNAEARRSAEATHARSFSMASVFALIGAFGWYKGSSYAPLWLGIAAIFAGLTLWRPQSLGLANRAWLRLGC
jgi:hypothetical protein